MIGLIPKSQRKKVFTLKEDASFTRETIISTTEQCAQDGRSFWQKEEQTQWTFGTLASFICSLGDSHCSYCSISGAVSIISHLGAILASFASAQCSVPPKQCAHNGQIDSHHFQCTPRNVLGLERSLTRRRTLKLRFCGDKQGHAVLLLSSAVYGSFTLESFLGYTRKMTLLTVLFLLLSHIGKICLFSFLSLHCFTCRLLIYTF